MGIVQQKWKCGKGPKSKIWIWHKWIHRGNKNMGVLTLPPFKKLKIGSQQHHSLSVQFSSVTQSCLTFCNPMNRSTPGFPAHHQLLELTQTHVHQVGDAIQPSHPLSSPSPPTFYLSQHQVLFQWLSSLYKVAKVLEFQLQHQSYQWIFRTHFL